ncbi:MAG: 7-cyano-7-deazaguanine synthase [Chloroflexi bacterium]|nr:7-cyano-7-deazaguanine synthase [Chloroflexota bacterium]
MPQPRTVAALVSGLDSAIMAGLLTEEFDRVAPLFVRAGLKWEEAERDALERYFEALGDASVQPLVELDLGARSLYGRHWSTGGEDVPDASRPDEEWYLPGRNLLLLSTAATYGAIHGIEHVAIGSLASNPFPDARPEFFRSLEQSAGLALDAPVHILTPLAGMHKAEVIRAGAHLPVQHALSCADPVDGGHCGVCGKCGERRRGFIDAGVNDPTGYARLGPL